MNISRSRLAVSIVICLLFLPALLRASDATNQLSATIDRFVPIITNTPHEDLQLRGLPESARKLILARFDFSEMTKRSLGSRWNSLNRGEQKQFVDAFTEWQLTYYGKILLDSRGERVQVNRELQHGKDMSVQTQIIGRYRDDLPIDYWLHNVHGQWKVYDMVIDDVDLVSNVHAQFERVILKSSLNDLLQRLKDQSRIS
jgi:phospholipid transport system substrate-binding protein